MLKEHAPSHRRFWLNVCQCRNFGIVLLLIFLQNRFAFADETWVWATGSTEKIQDQQRGQFPHDSVWDAATRTVRLVAVRGEHVPFQIVVSTRKRDLKNVQIHPPKLTCENWALPAENIQLFLLQLVNVYSATQDHGQSGRWPDALVPLAGPFDMRFYWHSQQINHQAIWVDLEMPVDQPPGLYRGSLDVTCPGVSLEPVKIELVVKDVTLPERRFPVHIGLYENHIARVHDVRQGSADFEKIFAAYIDCLMDYRCDPRTPPGLSCDEQAAEYRLVAQRPELENKFLERGRLQYWLSPVPLGVDRPTALPFPSEYQEQVRKHVSQVIQHSKKSGWYEKLGFHVPVDEPNTEQDYQTVRQWAELIKSADSRVPVAVTEQPKPEDPSWGSLAADVDCWITNGNYLHPDREFIAKQRAHGDQVFWYVSCDQLYPQPNLYIDRDAADPRMIPWIAWQYELDGFLYWNATYWGEVLNPWRDPVTWKTLPCNLPAAGEGSLLYPGNLVRQFSGQPDVTGPVASLRLALLREGLEDRALLELLAKQSGRKVVATMIGPVCQDIQTFSRDPNRIDQMRERVIEMLVDLKQ